jgi:anti-sigma regulatory factor (Ser/Thr protein kinase)
MAIQKPDDEHQHQIIRPRIGEPHQVLSALRMVGAGFETQGGASLMLTEAVENGVDAIIAAMKSGLEAGTVHLIIDNVNKCVVVIDDGTGFLKVRPALEKPYESVKADDPDQTGKWGRGLQGFRAFCNSLEFLTRRKEIPAGEESFPREKGADGRTLKIVLDSSTVELSVLSVKNEFTKYTKAEHGTIAIYRNWNKGQFEKLRERDVIQRLEHHFGEEIRKGKINISVEVIEGKIQGIGPEQQRVWMCKPREYSEFQKIKLAPVPYVANGKKQGEIQFSFYLTDRGRKGRWNYPYLLYEDRPVGDGFLADIDEFRDNPIWQSQYLTGYIACDFCHINETRTALKTGSELDFLFKNIKRVEPILEAEIKKHTKGLYDLRMQKQIDELVVDLQKFLKNKNVLDFKIARSTGLLTEEEKEVEFVQIVSTPGADIGKEVLESSGAGSATTGAAKFAPTSVVEGSQGGVFTKQDEIGRRGNGSATSKAGGPEKPGTEQPSGTDGFRQDESGGERPKQDQLPLTPGGNGEAKRKGRRPRPRGFQIVQQDDELNPEPSWFDGVNSAIVINSGNPRFTARADYENPRNKDLLDYMAELYLWEIAKLVQRDATPAQLGSYFLDLKFEYFEKHIPEKAKETAEGITSKPTAAAEGAA